MIKVRVQGMIEEIEDFIDVLKVNEHLEIQRASRLFSNKGTVKYYRMYLDIEQYERGKIYGKK